MDWRLDDGFAHVILDGKIIARDRCKEPALSMKGQVIDLWYSGKAHARGGNIQAVLAPDAFPLWISPAEPGSVHDITAARTHPLPALYHAAADPSSGPCAAWANAGSLCSPAAGASSTTSPPVPAKSGTSPAPRSC